MNDQDIMDLFPQEETKGSETYNYYNYEIHLLPLAEDHAPTVLRDYGYLIDTGSTVAILRGPRREAEIMVSAPSNNVWYVKNLGPVQKTLNA